MSLYTLREVCEALSEIKEHPQKVVIEDAMMNLGDFKVAKPCQEFAAALKEADKEEVEDLGDLAINTFYFDISPGKDKEITWHREYALLASDEALAFVYREQYSEEREGVQLTKCNIYLSALAVRLTGDIVKLGKDRAKIGDIIENSSPVTTEIHLKSYLQGNNPPPAHFDLNKLYELLERNLKRV